MTIPSEILKTLKKYTERVYKIDVAWIDPKLEFQSFTDSGADLKASVKFLVSYIQALEAACDNHACISTMQKLKGENGHGQSQED